jgi:hypothetical protein
MPRKFSRITLEVTDFRIERLQDLSDADALAEGIRKSIGGMWTGAPCQCGTSPTAAFAVLWNSINGRDGPGSWDANPYVYVISFKVLKK